MSKRIKRSFSNSDQVFHLWANKVQDSAYSKNVSFDGASIYSYGRHYELGRHVEFRGKSIVLINTAGYSKTTSKHICYAKRAVDHLHALDAPDFASELSSKSLGTVVRESILTEQARLVDDLMGVFSQRRFWSDTYAERYQDDLTLIRFNLKCEELGFPELVLEPSDEYKQMYGECAAFARERLNKLQSPEAQAKREEERLKRAESAIRAWRNGGPLTDAVRNLQNQILRINGDEVQTSRGASVPLSHALRLLRMLNRGTAKAGEKVGHYALSGLSKSAPNTHDGGETMIRIGCHTISLNEARAVLAPRALQAVGGSNE